MSEQNNGGHNFHLEDHVVKRTTVYFLKLGVKLFLDSEKWKSINHAFLGPKNAFLGSGSLLFKY